MPLNLHFSLLPEFRGAAPVAAAIAAGHRTTGVTIQRVVKKLDAGPVLLAREVGIDDDVTTDDLENHLAAVGADLTLRALKLLATGTASETSQDHDRATFAPMLAKSDGDTDFARPADEIVCHVRAMYSWPGAQAVFAGTNRSKEMPVTLVRTRSGPADDPFRGAGEVIEVTPEAIVVQTGQGALSILALKPAGKREQTAAEFANGYHVAPGDRFQVPIRRS